MKFLRNQQGIAHVFVLALLLAGLAVGTYAVQNHTNLFPKAQQAAKNPQPSSETSFSLGTGLKPTNEAAVSVGSKIQVNLLVASDIDAAGRFVAKLKFDRNKLEVTGITTQQMPYDDYPTTCVDKPECLDGDPACLLPEPIEGWCEDDLPKPSPLPKDLTCGGKENKQCPEGYACAIPEIGCADDNPNCEILGKCLKAPDDGKICAQVITKACTLQKVQCVTEPCPPIEICKEFPSPCDVPTGWNIINPQGSPFPPVPPYPKNSNIPKSSNTPLPKVTAVPRSSTIPQNTPFPSWKQDFFIQKWTEQKYDNSKGTISLVGEVPPPGFKTNRTTFGSKAIMAVITFHAKASGNAKVTFERGSAINRSSDNKNILTSKKDLRISVNKATPAPSMGPFCGSDKDCPANHTCVHKGECSQSPSGEQICADQWTCQPKNPPAPPPAPGSTPGSEGQNKESSSFTKSLLRLLWQPKP